MNECNSIQIDTTNLTDQTKFDYIDKVLIALSATSGGVSVMYFASVIGAPEGIASASFTLIFSLTTGTILLSILRNKKNMIKFLSWLNVNSIALKL